MFTLMMGSEPAGSEATMPRTTERGIYSARILDILSTPLNGQGAPWYLRFISTLNTTPFYLSTLQNSLAQVFLLFLNSSIRPSRLGQGAGRLGNSFPSFFIYSPAPLLPSLPFVHLFASISMHGFCQTCHDRGSYFYFSLLYCV